MASAGHRSYRHLSMTEPRGQIVILNGTSSAGKSSIAIELQRLLPGPVLRTGIDHFEQALPPDFVVFGDGVEPPAVEGLLFVTDADDRVTEMRLGPAAVRFKHGMYLAAQILAHRGFTVIVDDVLVDERVLRAAASDLASDAFFIGVHCPRHEARRREAARGDRPRGLVDTQFDLVHRHGRYDLDLDAHGIGPTENADAVRRLLASGTRPAALQALAEST